MSAAAILRRRIPGARLIRVLFGVPGWSDVTLLWSNPDGRFGGLMLWGAEAQQATTSMEQVRRRA